MGIDRVGVSVLWRPNNYRRKSRMKFRAPDTGYPVSKTFQDAKRSGKGVWMIRDYERVTVLLGSKSVTAIWQQRTINGAKEHFLFSADTVEILSAKVVAKREEIRVALDRVLVDVAERLRFLIEEPSWEMFEDYVRDEHIDKLVAALPRGCVVRDSFFKHVYDEGVEFVSSKPGEDPAERLTTYLKNTALMDVQPLIAAELAANRRETARAFAVMTKAIADLKQMSEKNLRAALSPAQKKLSRWDS